MQDARAARATLIKALETLSKHLVAGPESFPECEGDRARVRHISPRSKFHPEDYPKMTAVWLDVGAIREALRNDKPGVLLDRDIAPSPLLKEILDFVTDEVYELIALPAPPSMLRRLANLRQDLGGGKPRQCAVILQDEDGLILSTLADNYPVAVNQPELSGLTGLSKRVISDRLKWLEARPRRYVQRPENTQRKGFAITPAGLSAMGRSVKSAP